MKQKTGRSGVAHFRIETAAIHQKDVEPAVVVVVEQGRAAAHLLQQELLVLRSARDIPGLYQAGGGGDIREYNRTACAAAARLRRTLPRRRNRRLCRPHLTDSSGRQ